MELTGDQVWGMSRVQALRTMLTGEGVPESDRRIAQIMLEGPELTPFDEHRLTTFKPQRVVMTSAVRAALAQLVTENKDAHDGALEDLRELTGGRL